MAKPRYRSRVISVGAPPRVKPSTVLRPAKPKPSPASTPATPAGYDAIKTDPMWQEYESEWHRQGLLGLADQGQRRDRLNQHYGVNPQTGQLDWKTPEHLADPFAVTTQIRKLFRQNSDALVGSAGAMGVSRDGYAQATLARETQAHEGRTYQAEQDYLEANAALERDNREWDRARYGEKIGRYTDLVGAFADDPQASVPGVKPGPTPQQIAKFIAAFNAGKKKPKPKGKGRR